MSYLHTIKIALLVFPFIAFLCLYPFILLQYHKYGSINPLRFLILLYFLLYIITIYFLVILPLPNINTVTYNPNMIKLLPFNFLISIIEEAHFSLTDFSTYVTIFTEPCIYTVLFNILMTIPFGMYLKYYFNCSFSKCIFLTFFLSLFFELTQLTGLYFIYPYPYRIFDVDDLIMNTLGGVIGYNLMSYISPYLPSRVDIDKASYKEGHTVSGLRRIILFISDFFLYLLFSLFLSLIIPFKVASFICFLYYYIIYPYFNNTTLAGKYLRVSLYFKKHHFLFLILRILFLSFYYFYFPYFLFLIIVFLINKFNLSFLLNLFVLFLFFLFLILFYLVNVFYLLITKSHFSDFFFFLTYKSTINE